MNTKKLQQITDSKRAAHEAEKFEVALFKRAARKLAREGMILRRCRFDSKWFNELGRYYAVAAASNVVEIRHIDLYEATLLCVSSLVARNYEVAAVKTMRSAERKARPEMMERIGQCFELLADVGVSGDDVVLNVRMPSGEWRSYDPATVVIH